MPVCGGGVSGGAAAAFVAAAETSPIISWLSKQRQSEWPHRLLPVLLLLPISHFVSCSPHDVLTKKNPNIREFFNQNQGIQYKYLSYPDSVWLVNKIVKFGIWFWWRDVMINSLLIRNICVIHLIWVRLGVRLRTQIFCCQNTWFYFSFLIIHWVHSILIRGSFIYYVSTFLGFLDPPLLQALTYMNGP